MDSNKSFLCFFFAFEDRGHGRCVNFSQKVNIAWTFCFSSLFFMIFIHESVKHRAMRFVYLYFLCFFQLHLKFRKKKNTDEIPARYYTIMNVKRNEKKKFRLQHKNKHEKLSVYFDKCYDKESGSYEEIMHSNGKPNN